MSRYELSLTPNYVPDWTVVDAVRELFQNALDQQTVDPSNTMFFGYDYDSCTLRIGNKLSTLDASTLLLGSSTKANDSDTIGKFGEGYKVSTLVLVRLGKNVTFYNYGKREVWKPRFVKMKKYQGTEVLVFDSDKAWLWESIPDNNLTIVIEGITPDEYEAIVESNLHCQGYIGGFLETNYGRILLDERYQGRVFVNGLFICSVNSLQYGYDIKPKYAELDRDRRLISDFNMKWLTSMMWKVSGSELMIELARNRVPDVEYVKNTDYNNRVKPDICNKAFEEFIEEHGEKAVPVTNQSEMIEVKRTYIDAKPVIVGESHKHMIESSPQYAVRELDKVEATKTPKERLADWYNKVLDKLTEEESAEFDNIFDDII